MNSISQQLSRISNSVSSRQISETSGKQSNQSNRNSQRNQRNQSNPNSPYQNSQNSQQNQSNQRNPRMEHGKTNTQISKSNGNRRHHSAAEIPYLPGNTTKYETTLRSHQQLQVLHEKPSLQSNQAAPPLYGYSAILHGGEIFLWGGKTEWSMLHESPMLHRYHIERRKWKCFEAEEDWPIERYHHSAIKREHKGKVEMVVFGGLFMDETNSICFNDLWKLYLETAPNVEDPDFPRWECINDPEIDDIDCPGIRYAHAACYRKSSDSMIVCFGKTRDFDLVDSANADHCEIWEFNFSMECWKKYTFPLWDIERISFNQLARCFHSIFLRTDQETGHEILCILYGQLLDKNVNNYNDLYEFDLFFMNRFKKIEMMQAPCAREGQATYFDEQENILYCMGGVLWQSETKTSDQSVYAYDIDTKRWINLSKFHQNGDNDKRLGVSHMFMTKITPQTVNQTNQLIYHGGISSHDRRVSNLTFSLEISSKNVCDSFVPSPNQIQSDLRTIHELRSVSSLKRDVKLEFGYPQKPIFCHSWILSQSPVLWRLLQNQRTESSIKSSFFVIDMKNFPVHGFSVYSQLFDCLYGLNVHVDDYSKLRNLSLMLEIDDIVQWCELSLHQKNPLFQIEMKMSSDVQLNRSMIIKKSLSNAWLSMTPPDSFVLTAITGKSFVVHKSLLFIRAPEVLSKSSSNIISYIQEKHLEIILQFCYGVDIQLQEKKILLADLIHLLLLSFVLKLGELELQCLFLVKRRCPKVYSKSVYSILSSGHWSEQSTHRIHWKNLFRLLLNYKQSGQQLEFMFQIPEYAIIKS